MRFLLAVLLLLTHSLALWADKADDKFFNEKILPALKQHCFECHSKDAEEIKGGLRLDTHAGLRAGGDSGEIIKPGDPMDSLLVKVLRYDEDDRQMPPRGKLEQEVIEAFITWIKRGAVDPRQE